MSYDCHINSDISWNFLNCNREGRDLGSYQDLGEKVWCGQSFKKNGSQSRKVMNSIDYFTNVSV